MQIPCVLMAFYMIYVNVKFMPKVSDLMLLKVLL